MSNYNILTVGRLTFYSIDQDDEMEIETEGKYYDESSRHNYINKDQAIEIVQHLKQQFGL